MHDVEFYVVTEDNFDDFKERFLSTNGPDLVFFAISVVDYENLSLNVAEMKRYIDQQQELIVYYETSILQQDSNEFQSED
jgi:hypothetical protein